MIVQSVSPGRVNQVVCGAKFADPHSKPSLDELMENREEPKARDLRFRWPEWVSNTIGGLNA